MANKFVFPVGIPVEVVNWLPAGVQAAWIVPVDPADPDRFQAIAMLESGQIVQGIFESRTDLQKVFDHETHD